MRVLLAEDEETIAVTLKDALEEAGHQVQHAPDTAGALEILAAENPDVVLTDIRMPGAGGMELLRQAVAQDERRPVILMTGFGYDPHHSIVRASQEGLQSFLFKPFKATQLVDEVKRALVPPETGLVKSPDAPDET